jgi:4-amino-4-deoxy-L-arabinose transferase-like glycosyltransferase
MLLLIVLATLSWILANFQDSTRHTKLAFLHLDFKIPNSSTSQDAKLNHKPNIYLNILLPEQGKKGNMHA